MLAVAEMYINGVSTRDVEAVMREFGLERLSSSQVSRATKLLDEELEAWRNRPLGRRAGLRSFPLLPRPGSTCPKSDPKRLFLAVHSPSEDV